MKGMHIHQPGFRLTVFKLVSFVTLLLFSSQTVFALPSGQQVVNGQAGFSTQGNSLTVTNSPNAIIQWQGFSIGANEAVRFLQQSASSAVLNRVIGQDPSRILGLLQSNGRVFLINPNGILFGQGARIDVNGLVASTLNLSNADFLAGKYNFTSTEGAPAGALRNQGTIATPSGGKVYLIAPEVENTGLIHTPQGEVILAAGRSVHLVDGANPDIAVVVSAPQDAAVNLGQVIARSGQVGIYGSVISQQGDVSADSAVIGENGRIFFRASNNITLGAGSTTSANGPEGGQITIQSETGTTLVSGAVAARGGEGPGGDIRILGRQVGLIDDARIDASGNTGGGTVLIGGDYQGSNPAVQNAEAVFIGPDAVIRVDATENGDGGRVIVWSDQATRIYGAISAKGGISSGNGGFVETSGGYLDVSRAPDLLAPRGTGGEWLLDPNNITIQATGSNAQVTSAPNFTTTDDHAIVTTGSIETALNGGSNVSIVTGSQGANSEAGNITVADPVTWSTVNTLSLKAHNDINVNQALSANMGGKLILRADSDANGAGTVIFGGSGHVNMAVGNGGYTSIYYNPPGGYAAPTDYSGYFSGVMPTAYMLVNTVNNLQAMNTNLAGAYALGKDIDATATSGWDGGKGFLPIADSGATPFSGTFDGDGHIITGLYINRPTSTNYVGLFGHSSGVVRNVGLVNGNITGNGFVGGLVGYNYSALAAASISNSYSTGAVSGYSEVGGLVGENRGSISNSYSAAMITGTGNYYGGLVGNNYTGGAISNSYSTGAVTVTGDYVGGLVGYNGTGAISNSYSTGAVSGTGDYVGGLIGGFGGGAIAGSYWDTQTSGQAASAAGSGLTTAQFMTQASFTGWDFTNSWWMSGTNTRPFLRSEYRTEIANAHQLQLMALNLGASYILAADLDLGELTRASGLWNTEKGFVPVGSQAAPFSGTLDGLGHTITGLYINRGTDEGIGLFGYTSSTSSILNAGLINASILDGYHVGALVGDNYGLIQNAYSTGAAGAITGKSTVGGLVGWNWGTVRNSYSTLAISGDNGVGGLVGVNSGEIANSYSTAVVSYRGLLFYSESNMGGLVGSNVGTISNSYHTTGTVTGNRSNVGGLVGYNANNITGIIGSYNTAPVVGTSKVGGLAGSNSGKISDSYNSDTATVSGTGSDVGGLVGYNTGAISDSYNDGTVTGTGTYVGGLTGENYGGTITRAWNTGAVTGTNAVGGLVGDNYSSIVNSYNTGAVTGNSSVGGLVGYQDPGGSTSGSYNTGAVSGNDSVGGLVGQNYYGTVSKTYSTGEVEGNSAVGGLVGWNEGSVANSYSTGSVTGTGASQTRIGGLVGYNNASGGEDISYSYSTGAVSVAVDATNVGGLVGRNNEGTITHSYWDRETSGQDVSAGGTGLTTTQMTTQASFSGWDFTTVWGITAGATYPYLQGQALPYPAPPGIAPPGQQIISGMLDTAVLGKTVYFVVDGTLRPEMATTTAGGLFSVALPENSVTAGHALLAYVGNDGSFQGAIVYLASGGDITNLLISANTLTAKSGGGTMSNTTLGAAKGGLTSADIPYIVSNSNLALSSGFNFQTANGTPYQINGNVTTTNGSQTYNGPVTLAANAVLTSIGGTIFINATLNASTYGLTISGGNGVAVNGNLTSGADVILSSAHDIDIDASLTAANLILQADSDGNGTGTVNFTENGSAAITGGGTASIFYNPPDGYAYPTNYTAYFTGATPTAYMLVNDVNNLQAIGDNLAGVYALGRDIDASATSAWNSGAGFVPLGNDNLSNPAELFTGIFDGLGHTITGLYINRPSTNYVGLFGGSNETAVFRNVGLVNVNITGGFQTGGLVAHTVGLVKNVYTTGTVTGTSNTVGGVVGLSAGTTSDAYSTATVSGNLYVGGVIGANYETTSRVVNCYSTGVVSGTDDVGGLAGYNAGQIDASYSTATVNGNDTVGGFAGINLGAISASYSSGPVNGESNVGGLAGQNDPTGTITDSWSSSTVTASGSSIGGLVGFNGGAGGILRSYSTGAVSGDHHVGGLVGYNGADIDASYSTGAVSGNYAVGGLAGINWSVNSISNSYSTGAVTGTGVDAHYIGGLVGDNPGAVSGSYSTGLVSGGIGSYGIGGLIGHSDGAVAGSYWNTETSGQATSAGGTGLTTAQMTTPASFSGWDFTSTWGITEGTTYPHLLWQPSGTFPTPPGVQPPDNITPGLVTPEVFGNTVAAGDTVVALLTVTAAIFSPDAVIPSDPFVSPDGTAEDEDTAPSTETATDSEKAEEIARREAARQIGGLKRDAHPDDEKAQKYCN
jgi:filamentous hemagglutinin family protein